MTLAQIARASFAFWRFTRFGTFPETCAAQWHKHRTAYTALALAWLIIARIMENIMSTPANRTALYLWAAMLAAVGLVIAACVR